MNLFKTKKYYLFTPGQKTSTTYFDSECFAYIKTSGAVYKDAKSTGNTYIVEEDCTLKLETSFGTVRLGIERGSYFTER